MERPSQSPDRDAQSIPEPAGERGRERTPETRGIHRAREINRVGEEGTKIELGRGEGEGEGERAT